VSKIVNDEQLRFLEWMWTTNKNEFFLVEVAGRTDYLISRITPGPPRVISSMIIEDDEVYRAVQEKLKSSGVRIITPEEMRKIRGH
jgi:hypothetical protein